MLGSKAKKIGFVDPPPGGGFVAVTKKMPPNCKQLDCTVAVRLVDVTLLAEKQLDGNALS